MLHTPANILAKKLAEAQTIVAPGSFWYHYKHPDQHYQILTIGLLEATEEPCVVYQALYGTKLTFIRPLNNWLETVEANGQSISRFTAVSSSKQKPA